jgi:hypothetical protein
MMGVKSVDSRGDVRNDWRALSGGDLAQRAGEVPVGGVGGEDPGVEVTPVSPDRPSWTNRPC